jgi:hypothetical protein
MRLQLSWNLLLYHMRHKLCALLSLCVAALGAHAASTNGSSASADNDWSSIITLSAPTVVTASSPSDVSDTAKKSPLDMETDRLVALAQHAKAFYTDHSGDPRAVDAKKLEVMSRLQAIQLGAPDADGAGMALAHTYRSNSSNSTSDRLDVALAMQAIAANHAGNGLTGAALESATDALRSEFGDAPEIYSLYLNIVRTADSATALRVAQKLQSLPAPGPMKAEAAKVLGRAALIGTSIDLTKQIPGLHSADLRNSGGVTVIYLWNASSGYSDLDLLASQKSVVPDTAHFVYVGLGSTPGAASAASSHAAFKGAHFFDGKSLDSDVAAILNVEQLPYVFVLKADGTLSGYGRAQDISALVAAANR